MIDGGFDGIVADVDNAGKNQDQVWNSESSCCIGSSLPSRVERRSTSSHLNRDRSVSYRNKHKHDTAYPGVRLGLGSHSYSFLGWKRASLGEDFGDQLTSQTREAARERARSGHLSDSVSTIFTRRTWMLDG
jgi:hypothetical protein